MSLFAIDMFLDLDFHVLKVKHISTLMMLAPYLIRSLSTVLTSFTIAVHIFLLFLRKVDSF